MRVITSNISSITYDPRASVHRELRKQRKEIRHALEKRRVDIYALIERNILHTLFASINKRY